MEAPTQSHTPAVSDDEYLAAIENVRDAKKYRDHCLKMLHRADVMENDAYAELDRLKQLILEETMGNNAAS